MKMEKQNLKYNEILSELEDEESKFVYQKKAEYYESGDFSAIRAIVDRYLPELSDHLYYPGIETEVLDVLKDRKNIVLFGVGLKGKKVLKLLKTHHLEAAYIADNDSSKWGSLIDGTEIKNPQNIDFQSVDAVVITPYEKVIAEAIYEQVVRLGAREDSLVYYRDYCFTMLEQEQYFDPEIIKLHENEVFVDAGVLNLGTSLQFVEECRKNHIKNYKILAFEPDALSYERCLDMLKELPNLNLQMYHAGLWSEDTTLYFAEMGNGGSRITQQKTETFIQAVSLDHCVSDAVTFIKMDIEGAELEALKGCQEIIKKYKPKLAISIYHKKADLVEIPLFIKNLVPEYRLYIRHYSDDAAETVLYAVI